MVDYNEIAETKHWTDMKSQKLQRVLYVLYVHDNNVNAWDWKVVKTFLWSPNSSQSAKIQSDYEIMRKKVLAGENLKTTLALQWISKEYTKTP